MKIKFTLIFALLLSGIIGYAQTGASSIISVNELVKNFDNYKIIDVSPSADFQKEAITGALNVWRPQITDANKAYGGLMASPEQMATLLGNLGITENDNIILYDHKGGSDAARLWWVLKSYGHPNVSIINGGFKAWGDNNKTIELDSSATDTVLYNFPVNNKASIPNAAMQEVFAAISDDSSLIIDTRTKDEYEGVVQKKGAFKKGRIPSSIHIDWADNIDYHGNQLLLDTAELLAFYEGKGITKDKNIIVYCHSGSRSSHTALVLSDLLGYPNVSNYDGSWIEWSYIDTLPIDTGVYIPQNVIYEASYGEVFWSGFKDFGNYTWNEITCKVSPWYVNYFWWLVILSLVVWGLEVRFPWRKNQPIFRKDFWIDAFFMFFNFYIFKLVIFMSFSEVTAKFFHNLIGGDVTSYALFDMSGWNIGVQLLIFFVVTDFIQWFTHVMLHRFDIFWRFHKVHHSIEEMGFAGHLRYHWMENVFYTPMKYITVMLIGGFTPEMAYIVFYISIAIGHFNHANIGWSYGPLKYVFNNPKMHIWHHAKQLPEDRRFGVNFGISLSVWDYLFKKNYIPADGRDIELGFDGIEEYPKGFFGLIFSGFKKNSK